MYDVAIIGAGVVGCAVARELSRYEGKFCVIEKNEDVCCGTSKANSAIVHAGFDAACGSLMAKLNVLGNERMEQLAHDLDVPFRRNGSLVVCTNEEDLPTLQALYDRGIANGVKELQILSKEETLDIEPNLSEQVLGALYAKTAGIICPFTLTIALAENAKVNGIDFYFNEEVMTIEKNNDFYTLVTTQGEYDTKVVVNAAGVHSDEFHNLMSRQKIHITPRRGDYCLLDKEVGAYVSHTIFPVPSKLGKGVLISPTIHGNLIVGPTAVDIEQKEGTNTTREGLNDLISKAGATVKALPIRKVITSFAGLRAHEDGHEFIIGEVSDSPGFFDVAGIESPGLTSAPAIGLMVAHQLQEKLKLNKKETFTEKRKGVLNPGMLTMEERNELIKQQPAYGNILCRCENISEGEILDAIRRPLGAKSLDSIKRRTRAGMGRCQGGFCSPKVMEILKRELNLSMTELTKCGGNSQLVTGRNKEQL